LAEPRSDRAHRFHFGGEAALDAAAVRIGRSEALLGREEQGNVDRNAGCNRLFDRGNAGAIAGDLDEQVRTPCTGMKRFRLSYGRCGIVGEKRRDLQRHPAVGAAARLERRPEKSRGTGQILQGEPEENRFIGSRTASGFSDAPVVPACLPDGLVEDRRIGRKAAQRELPDVPGYGAVVQDFA
jgi:hypothetical protein